MIVTKTHLSRRTILRGLGASVALPLLDGMIPALSALGEAKPVRRLTTLFLGNGMSMGQWTPGAAGALELSPILQPLAAYQKRLVVVSGLDNVEAIGSDAGPHPRAQTTWLTGARARRTEGIGVGAGISMDQIAAKAFENETQLASLELAIEGQDLGACSTGYSCVYQNTISWRTATAPLPMESNPRAVFERLFGAADSTDPRVRMAGMKKQQSILDSVTEKVASLERILGPGDRSRFTDYLDSVRDVERRIQKTEQQATKEVPIIEQPAGVPANYDEHVKLMFDLLVLAYQSDLTRVSAFMMARDGSHRAYPEIGIPDAHHPLSHDRSRRGLLAKLNTFHMAMFEYFLTKLASVPDGDGSLLDHSMALVGCGMSDPADHLPKNVPTLVFSGDEKLFGIKGGRHIQVPGGTPLPNLQIAMLDKMGVQVDHFGASTEEFTGL